MNVFSTISRCRLCGSDNLSEVLSLGDFRINAFPKTYADLLKVPRCPLTLMQCAGCSLVQLKHSVKPELLYQHYWYRSGINEVIVNDLKEIAELAMTCMKPGDSIMDIGANDGTLLSFIRSDFSRIGVEPSPLFSGELKERCDIMLQSSFEDAELPSGQKAKVITAIGMFYDLEDPQRFINKVAEHLDADGIFIAQLMCAKQMVENADVGNICHEHLEYYTFDSLKLLFGRAGLEIIKVEENKINGGSYRIFAHRSAELSHTSVDEPMIDWAAFSRALKSNRAKLLGFIHTLQSQGKRIYGYGASTKGNIIAQWLKPNLIAVADRNPNKIGRYMLDGSLILDEASCRRDADIFLVYPYGLLPKMIEREQDWIMRGGRFIVPFPKATYLDAGSE